MTTQYRSKTTNNINNNIELLPGCRPLILGFCILLSSGLDHSRHAGHQTGCPGSREVRPERWPEVAPAVRMVFFPGKVTVRLAFLPNQFQSNHVPLSTSD